MNYSGLTPYDLGETGDKEAIEYLIRYLANGNTKEKSLSALAINKLSKLYSEECNKAKPYLIKNLNNEYPWVRQYTLKALLQLNISEDDIELIKEISKSDDKQYNKDIANQILNKYTISSRDREENTMVIPNYGHVEEELKKTDVIINYGENECNLVEKFQLRLNKSESRGLFINLIDVIKKVSNVFINSFRPYKKKVSIKKENLMHQDKLKVNKETKEVTYKQDNVCANKVMFEAPPISRDSKKFLDCNNDIETKSSGCINEQMKSTNYIEIANRGNEIRDLYIEKEMIKKEVIFGEALSERNFLLFLDYCNNIKYNFDGSLFEQREIIKRYNNLLKSRYLCGVNEEIQELESKFRLFNISDSEIRQYFNLERELSEELMEEYTQLANEFINLLIEGLNKISINQRDINILLSRYNFYGDKAITLKTIGNEYGISRERVRQLLNKANRKLANAFRKNYNRELFKIKQLTNHLLNPDGDEFNKRFVLFLVYGFESANTKRLIKMFSELICGWQHEDIIKGTYEHFINNINKKLEIEKKIQNNIKIFDTRIGDRIKWPKNVRRVTEQDYKNIMAVREVNFDNESDTGDYISSKMNRKIQYESHLERKVLSILENCEKVTFYGVQPYIIPYQYKRKRNYIPDIFFVLEDGREVVVEVKPIFHMALDLNIQKYNALKEYCEQEGYGMLVTDGRSSIEELKAYDYNKNFEEELLQRLKIGPIKWSEFSILKEKHNVGYRDLASIVIKNNLLYDTGPFVIAMR